MDILLKLQQEFDLKPWQVENTVKLIDEDNTIPFISRYRKEATGGLDDQTLRKLHDRLEYLRNLQQRKEEIIRLIDEQDKLTDELVNSINAAEKLQELEDIYRPYRPKRRTRATIAKEKGLEPLADLIFKQNIYDGDIDKICQPYLNENVPKTSDALAGAMDIIAENISDNADFRKYIRNFTFNNGIIETKESEKQPETTAKGRTKETYMMYFDFSEPVRAIANHRVLAIDRGEREGFLKVKISVDTDKIIGYLNKKLIPEKRSITSEYVEAAAKDAYQRLIEPSIERDIRNSLTDNAQEGAIKVFSSNLKHLLLQPPIRGKVVLGIDPAYRTGCKLAVVDETGRVLEVGVIYPTPPENKIQEAEEIVAKLIKKYNINLISIGNGTASKETEIFVSNLIKKLDEKVLYTVVSESGASVYSASELAAEEFPDFDVSQRSAVSIARRLQDPLAELVKIDPKAIGVGQYQHDMNQKRLGEALSAVVEDAVNSVGVDLNTASASLLSYVSGISNAVAKNIVKYREENGKFKERSELLEVKKLGPKVFEQCAGFLRIPDAKNILDNTAVHPESYEAAGKLLELTGYTEEDLKNNRLDNLKDRIEKMGKGELASRCGVGILTLNDIADELLKPGRDPRDELPQVQLLENVMDINDLTAGMVLTGTVRNVADFGAFVDIGVHQDGLVHISELSEKYVKHPIDVVNVGQTVKVKVLDIDKQRNRISLSMKGI